MRRVEQRHQAGQATSASPASSVPIRSSPGRPPRSGSVGDHIAPGRAGRARRAQRGQRPDVAGQRGRLGLEPAHDVRPGPRRAPRRAGSGRSRTRRGPAVAASAPPPRADLRRRQHRPGGPARLGQLLPDDGDQRVAVVTHAPPGITMGDFNHFARIVADYVLRVGGAASAPARVSQRGSVRTSSPQSRSATTGGALAAATAASSAGARTGGTSRGPGGRPGPVRSAFHRRSYGRSPEHAAVVQRVVVPPLLGGAEQPGRLEPGHALQQHRAQLDRPGQRLLRALARCSRRSTVGRSISGLRNSRPRSP